MSMLKNTNLVLRSLLLIVAMSLFATTRADILIVSSTEVQDLLDQDVALVDIRRKDEWKRTGVIHDSKLLTFFDRKGNHNIERWLQEVAKITDITKPIIIICETGYRSTLLSNLLAESAVNLDINLAKKVYTKLLKRSPDDLSILNNLAWVEYELGNYPSANKLADRALVINNTHPQVLDTAALIKLKLGDKKKAIKLFKEAISLAPDDKEIAKHYKDAIQ